jgi:hypothetical protein
LAVLKGLYGKNMMMFTSVSVQGGKWSEPNSGPSKPAQWARIESYMGLLEHMNKMLNERILREDVFQEIYGYRINNVFYNDIIRKEKLEIE